MQAHRNDRPASGHAYLVDRKRGSTWYIKYRLPSGRQVQRKLGPAWTGRGRPAAGHFTRATARAELDALLTDARRGQLPGAITTGVTFSVLADEWLDYIEHDRKRRASTVVGYRSALDKHLRPAFGGIAIESITAEDIDAFRRRLVREGRLAARSVNKLLMQVHSILKLGVRRYKLPANAASSVERQPLRPSGDFSVLSPAEVAALARAAASEQDGAVYAVAAFTGLRMGELRALRWSDVSFTHQLIHVRRSYTSKTLDTPKSGKVRSVPLIDQAAKVLDGLSRREHFTSPDDLVFVSEVGGYVDESALRRRFVAALDSAGIERLRFHDLRHTFGTLAVRAFALSDVRAYMGHADISTTMIYVHHVPQHDAATRLGEVIAGTGDFVSRNVSRTLQNSDQLSELESALASQNTAR